MNSSILNGKDIAKVVTNEFITYRPNKHISFGKMEEQIKYILRETNFEYGFYSFEKDKVSKLYHAHILVKCENNNIDEILYANIKGYSKKISGIREVIVKIPQKLIDMKTSKKITRLVDTKVLVEFRRYEGRIGNIHAEKTISKFGSAFYTCKFTNFGIISGFIINDKFQEKPHSH